MSFEGDGICLLDGFARGGFDPYDDIVEYMKFIIIKDGMMLEVFRQVLYFFYQRFYSGLLVCYRLFPLDFTDPQYYK